MDDAASFFRLEAAAWLPFELLGSLEDDDLTRPVPAVNDWSGRDLMGHLVFWQEVALALARDLAERDDSPSFSAFDAEWQARGPSMNDKWIAEWRSIPLDELRGRFADTRADLRGALAQAPTSRWWDDERHRQALLDETISHYEEHAADLEAILAEIGGEES